jgi:hypothetical protein
MVALRSSEILVTTYQTIRYHNLEYNMNLHCHQILILMDFCISLPSTASCFFFPCFLVLPFCYSLFFPPFHSVPFPIFLFNSFNLSYLAIIPDFLPVFWDVTQSNLVYIYKCFVRLYCLRVQGRRIRMFLSFILYNLPDTFFVVFLFSFFVFSPSLRLGINFITKLLHTVIPAEQVTALNSGIT